MIECQKLKATIPESTCIARQKILAKGAFGWSNTVRRTAYNTCLQCKDCEIGLRLYREKQEEEPMEKECAKCNVTMPKDLNHFDKATRAADGLTNACRWCRNTAPETIRCDECNREIPLEEKWLVPDPDSKLGFETVCRKCQGKPASNDVEKPELSESEELPAIISKPEGRRICLDLPPELWAKVESWARTWNRTPQQQIVYHLASSKLRDGKAA